MVQFVGFRKKNQANLRFFVFEVMFFFSSEKSLLIFWVRKTSSEMDQPLGLHYGMIFVVSFEPIEVFPKIVVPQNGWFRRENPMKMDDLGVPLFSETSIGSSSADVSHGTVDDTTFGRRADAELRESVEGMTAQVQDFFFFSWVLILGWVVSAGNIEHIIRKDFQMHPVPKNTHY